MKKLNTAKLILLAIIVLIICIGIIILINFILKKKVSNEYKVLYYADLLSLVSNSNKTSESIKALKKCASTFPKDSFSHYTMAQLYLDGQDYVNAEKQLLVALGKEWNYEFDKAIAYCELSYIYLIQGKVDLSNEYLVKAQYLYPSIGELLYELGVANYGWGNIDKAERILRCLIRVSETKIDSIDNLKIEKALELIEQGKTQQNLFNRK